MIRYLVDAETLTIDGPCVSQASASGVPKVRVYIAPAVDTALDVERRALAAANERADTAAKWEAEANRLRERIAELESAYASATKLSAEVIDDRNKRIEELERDRVRDLNAISILEAECGRWRRKALGLADQPSESQVTP